MIEYIKLTNKLSGEKNEDILDIDENKYAKNFEFSDIDIPEDYEAPNIYSSTAKSVKNEICEYLMNSSENEKLFYKIREKIYNGDIISTEYLSKFAVENKFDRM